MQFEIARQEILAALTAAVAATETKGSIPILSHLLVTHSSQTVEFTGTDSELEVRTCVTVPASLDDGGYGSIAVPAAKFLDIVKNLPANADITFTLKSPTQKNSTQVEVKSGKSRFTLSTLYAEDFPSAYEISEGTTLTLSTQVLKDALAQASYAMAQNDARYYLNGMCVHLMEEKLAMVATDGHRLALAEESFDLQGREPRQVIVPRKAIIELMRMLENSDDEVAVAIDESHIQFKISDSLMITSKLIDGKYPDYYGVIPFQANKIATADVGRLKTALSQASILSNEKYRGIKLVLAKNLLTVTSSNPDQEEAEVECEVDYGDDDLEIGFNVNYLQDVLGVVTTKEIELRFSDSNSSCLLMQKDIDTVKFVVMPMRL